MYNIKGFIEINALADNMPSDGNKENVSPLGELSSMSLSYSREKGYFTINDAPNCELITFSCKKEEDIVSVPAKYYTHILKISQWVYNNSVSGALSDDPEQFRRLFLAEFSDSIGDVEIGRLVSARGNWMPSFLTWNLDDGEEENEIRIWYADEAFKAQYDEYEIVVIPPVEPVDTFMKTIQYVGPALDAFNLPDHDQKTTDKVNGYPYSERVTNEYTWYDREDKETHRQTFWSVAIYGVAGKNPLAIKEAIAEYILAHSAFVREDWIPVFPDIFTSTEFVIVPMWYKRSVPDETARGQMYSPILSHDEVLKKAQKYIKYPKSGHVKKYLQSSLIQYKSLAFVTAGGVENRDNKYLLSDYFPKYIVTPTMSGDFNRMDKRTTDWVHMLYGAVIAAEEMDEYSYLDVEYARVERDGLMFVGFSYENVLYLVLARTSMEEAVLPSDGV
jgi:hypothetical protein